MTAPSWICCQLGAREHYAIPRALNSQHRLSLLVTDAWASSRFPLGLIPGHRAQERFHPELIETAVDFWNWKALGFELTGRRGHRGWDLIYARNEWFQNNALVALKNYARRNRSTQVVLFSFSYSARKLLEFAKSEGWQTVLGQIDPGPVHESIILNLRLSNPRYSADCFQAPPQYWESWRQECDLADRIIVNSKWSQQALMATGIAAHKLSIAPLAFQPPAKAGHFERVYPKSFSRDRPLRALFLGNVGLGKGIGPVLDAVEMLNGEPVEFRIVGAADFEIPEGLRKHPSIEWVGPVSRASVAAQYKAADVFLFPTFSDGFGLTQLEAQSWKLPTIASRNCGEVVVHLQNGYLLDHVKPQSIVTALHWFLEDPRRLDSMAKSCEVDQRFSLTHLSTNLLGVERSLLEHRTEVLPG